MTVDVDLDLPPAVLPARDRVRDVFDYDRVARLVVEEGVATQHRLLESYAQVLLTKLLAETPAEEIRVRVAKLRAPTTYSVDAITVELVGRRG